MSTNQRLILNTLMVDYLRLATFDHQAYLKILPGLRQQGSGWKGAKWLQYSGQRSEEGFFYGLGEQSGRGHFIIQASGAMSHKLYIWLRRVLAAEMLPFYCTRIDLQATKSRPEGFDHLASYKRIRGKKSVILGDDGHTLYIGARTSDTFWRIYDKTAEYLRVEIEIKGKQAKRSWQALLAGEEIDGVWNRFLLRSRVPKMLVDAYRGTGEAVELEDLEIVEDLEGKLAWLAQLDGLAWKLANDHDVGERARGIFKRWSEYGQK